MRALGLAVLLVGGVAWAKPTKKQATRVAQDFVSNGTSDFFASPDPSDGLARFTIPFEAGGWGKDWTCERGKVKKKSERAGMGACIAGHMPGFADWDGWSADAAAALTPKLAAMAADFAAMAKTATVVYSVNHIDATSTNAAVFAVTMVKGKPKISAVFVEAVEK